MKRISLLIAAVVFCFPLYAQYLEVGSYLGTSNYLGDLSENRLLLEESNLMLGIIARYNATPRLSLKASLIKGGISGSDKNAQQSANRDRNLNFRSDIFELALTSEVNFSPYNVRDNKTGMPYFFSGLALTRFNPEAQMRGSWHELQPLRTEGNKYSILVISIPFGLGLKFNLTHKLNVGLELGARRTFTDYLDDVSGTYPDIIGLRSTNPETAALSYRTPEITGSFSQNPVGSERGDAINRDWYFFGGLTFTVNLTDKYGLDFDPNYSIFKEHLKKPKKPKVNKKLPKKEMNLKERIKKIGKRNILGPQVKKTTN